MTWGGFLVHDSANLRCNVTRCVNVWQLSKRQNQRENSATRALARVIPDTTVVFSDSFIFLLYFCRFNSSWTIQVFEILIFSNGKDFCWDALSFWQLSKRENRRKNWWTLNFCWSFVAYHIGIFWNISLSKLLWPLHFFLDNQSFPDMNFCKWHVFLPEWPVIMGSFLHKPTSVELHLVFLFGFSCQTIQEQNWFSLFVAHSFKLVQK